MDPPRHPPTLGAGLSIPRLAPSTGRADIPGSSPICVGNRPHTVQVRSRGDRPVTLRDGGMTTHDSGLTLHDDGMTSPTRPRSPSATRLEDIGVPLYGRSRSCSPLPTMRNQETAASAEELRNLARQPSNAESTSEYVIRDPSSRPGQTENRESAGIEDTTDLTVFGNCSCASHFTPHMEDAFRRRLRFFFMNPCQKWRAKRRFPYKLVLQVLKVLIVTLQLMYFGTERSGHVDFIQRNNIALKHLYVYQWDASFETLPYPPATGQFAVYEIDTLLDGLDYTMTRYSLTKQIALGSYDFANINGTMPPPQMCVTHFEEGEIWPHNQSYQFNANIITHCVHVYPMMLPNGTEKYDIRTFMDEHNITINFDRLNFLEVRFPLKTVHLKIHNLEEMTEADCFQFNVSIMYDNSNHNGQLPLTLTTKTISLHCRNETIIHGASRTYLYAKRTMDSLVIIVGTISFFLCLRTLFRARKLRKMACHFFKIRFNRKLSFYEKSEFLNLWDVLILINDFLTVSGTVAKLQIEFKNSENYELSGMLLGVGCLLVWLGVLRYLSFFEHYNILILTMKHAIPDICRFLVCASVLYLGFAFCGWVVLGPYHIKFASIGSSSECLFALVNGDEIFVTFASVRVMNNYIYYFSRIYLYLFISLFMYVVYSLFTSIIITTYETIKFYYREGFPKSLLQSFIDEHHEDANSPLFMADEGRPGCYCCLLPCFCCRRCRERSATEGYPDEYTPLIN